MITFEADHFQTEITSYWRNLHASMPGNVATVLFSVDEQGRLLWWNYEFQRIIGLGAAELAGEDFVQFFHPHEAKDIQELLHDRRKGGLPVSVRRLHTRDGFQGYRLLLQRIFSSSGEFQGLWCVGQSLSAEAVPIEALQESESRFRQLTENLQSIFWLSERPSGKFLYINPAFEKFFGFPRDEVFKDRNTVAGRIHQDDRETIMKALFGQNNQAVDLQFRLLRPDGHILHMHASACPVRDRAGNVIRMAGFCEDVTPLVTAEQTLRESHDELQVIYDGTMDGILIADGLTGRFLRANPGVCQIFGFTAEELLTMKIGDLALPEDVIEAFDTITRHLTTSHLVEVPFRRKNGKLIFCDVSARIVTYKGRHCIIAFFTEVTERHSISEELRYEREELSRFVDERTEELKIANVELARASRLKDEFLANMSHELRTPLNAVLSLAEALGEQVRGSLNEHQLKSVRVIEESGRHLLALINDILDLSKIEAGRLDFQFDDVDFESIVRSSLHLVRQLASKKKLQIGLKFDSLAGPIRADERRVKQILVNLLSNAVKFTPEGGNIGLELVQDPERNCVRCTVWDTGIGISPEELPRLFRPFTQLAGGLNRQHDGTGLGLALTAKLVERHGGTLEVESRVGCGSRFSFSLPLAKAFKADPDDLREKQGMASSEKKNSISEPPFAQSQDFSLTGLPPGISPRILVVDDNPTNAESLVDYLRARGFQPISASNGRDALESMSSTKPDIVLMDIQMPVMDGLEAIRCIRAHSTFTSIPIIAFTALAMPGDRELCFASGANEYLSKPVSLPSLMRTIIHLLRKNE
ncbi:MAG: PAS domain S-box protein [Candidatus Ozemobacteraceae bacterium]